MQSYPENIFNLMGVYCVPLNQNKEKKKEEKKEKWS